MSIIRIMLAHRDRALAKNVHNAVAQSTNLEWMGHATCEADVLHGCAANPPDVLLLDTQLDDAPALSVIRAVQRLEHPPKIVGFASSSDPTMIRAMLRNGASGYLLTSEPLHDSLAVLPLILNNKIVLSSSLISSLPE